MRFLKKHSFLKNEKTSWNFGQLWRRPVECGEKPKRKGKLKRENAR